MMKMIIQTKRRICKSGAAAHAASVDATADVELLDPDSEQGHDTTEHNNQGVYQHEESSHDSDSNPCLDEIPKDELEPWVDSRTRAKCKVDGLSAANEITLWILRQIQTCCRQAG